MSQISYKDAGVDIDAGNSFVQNIKPLVKSTKIPGVLGGIGSFAGAFELPKGFKEPVMLAATDGVGTKLKLAIDSGIHNTVGIDLVAMCVNDLLCNFGTPSFFLSMNSGTSSRSQILWVAKPSILMMTEVPGRVCSILSRARLTFLSTNSAG